MIIASVKCPKCATTFKIKFAVPPQSVFCPTCKGRFPLPAEAIPPSAPSRSTVETAPSVTADASNRSPSKDKTLSLAFSRLSVAIGLFSLVLVGVILIKESYVFKYPSHFHAMLEYIMERLQFVGADYDKAFVAATFLGIIILVLSWGLQIAVLRGRVGRNILYPQWVTCALTLFYFLVPLPLKFSWSSGAHGVSFYRERSAFYDFDGYLVAYLMCGTALISITYVIVMSVRVLRKHQAVHLIFTSPLPFITVQCFAILAMGFAGTVFSRTRTSLSDRDMFMTVSLLGALLSMVGWFVWQTIAARESAGGVTEGIAAAPRERLAVWSLCLGCSGIVFNIIAGVPAVVCGHIALARIRKTSARGRGMAIAGLVLGYLFVVVFVFSVLLPLLRR